MAGDLAIWICLFFGTGETPDIRDFNKVAWLQTFPDVGDTNMPRQWVWALAAIEVMIQFASSPRSRFSHGCPRAWHATATCTIYIAHFSTEAMPYRAILPTTCTKIFAVLEYWGLHHSGQIDQAHLLSQYPVTADLRMAKAFVETTIIPAVKPNENTFNQLLRPASDKCKIIVKFVCCF